MSKAEFRWVAPADLGQVWPSIRPGLETTASKAPGGWLPEDVYMEIKGGGAVLHTVIVDSYYRGFIVSKSIDAFEGRKLLIWICHGDASGDVLSDNLDQLQEWAKNIGAVKIQFQSPRKGWEKVGAKLGFVPTMTIYECEV